MRVSVPSFHTMSVPGQTITMLEIKPDGTVKKTSKVLMRIHADHADLVWGSAQLLQDFHQDHMPDLRIGLGGLEGWNKRQTVPMNVLYEKEKYRVEKYLVYFSCHAVGEAHVLAYEEKNPGRRYSVFGNVYVAQVDTNSLLEKPGGAKYIQTQFLNIPEDLDNDSKRDLHRRFVIRAAEGYLKNSENLARPWEPLP